MTKKLTFTPDGRVICPGRKGQPFCGHIMSHSGTVYLGTGPNRHRYQGWRCAGRCGCGHQEVYGRREDDSQKP